MRYCGKCGKEVKQGMRYCGFCGAAIMPVGGNPDVKSIKKVILLFLFILILAAYLLSKAIYTGGAKTNQISDGSRPDKEIGRGLDEADAAAAVEGYLEAKIFRTLSDTEYYEVRSGETYPADNKIYVPIYAPTGDRGLDRVYVAVVNAAGAGGDVTIFYNGDDGGLGLRLEEFNAFDYL